MDMDFDLNTILLCVLFGSVGTAYIVYACKAGKLVPGIAGLALCVVPYFVNNIWVLLIVCLILTAAPFYYRDL
jgi:hypothetical protein